MEEKDILLNMVQALNATIASLSQTNAAQAETISSLEHRIKELTAQVAYLNRQLFGRKSEKLAPQYPGQLSLFDDILDEPTTETPSEEPEEVVTKVITVNKKQARKNRTMLENLPVLKRDVIDVEGIDLTRYRKIGEEVTEVVEFEPGKLYRHQYVRIKYGLINPTESVKSGEGVKIAPMPLLPIYKGIAGASLLTEILLQKYEYHLPFYRQIKQFTHLGIKGLTESTIDGWFKQVVQLLTPLYKALKKEVFKSDYCQADETTTPVVDREKHKTSKEYLWMVRSVMEKLVFFHYENGSRAGNVIESLTQEYKFKGYLQCDGFAGYESAFKTHSDISLVNCMAHIRRKFENAMEQDKKKAEYALSKIQQLYLIEKECDKNEVSIQERKEMRQLKATPIMNELKEWFEKITIKYGSSTLLGKAAGYAYLRWDNMMRYLDDGRIKIDNNLAENEIRPITLGRKNYLFCGNHTAAENMCVITSLLSTCRNHDVNPREYLNSIIAKMPYLEKSTHEQLVELLPHRWKQNQVAGTAEQSHLTTLE